MRRKQAKITAQMHANNLFGRHPNTLELALRRLLTEAGFSFEEQVPFDRCTVDAWVPEYGLAFEADGTFWHTYNENKNPGRYKRRDAFLLRSSEVNAVIRLTESDLAPWRVTSRKS